MVFFSFLKKYIFSFLLIPSFLVHHQTKTKNIPKNIKRASDYLIEIGLATGISLGFGYLFDKFYVSLFKNKDVLICEKPPFNSNVKEFTLAQKQIKKIIKQINKNGKHNRNKKTIVFVSEEPEITSNEKKLISHIPHQLDLQFCEIKLENIDHTNHFLEHIKKQLAQEDTIYFIQISNVKAIYNNLEMIPAINKILSEKEKSFLILHATKETFELLEEFLQNISKETVFFGFPDKEAYLEYIKKIIKEHHITIEENFTLENITNIVQGLSITELENIFNEIIEHITTESDEQKFFTKKMLLNYIEKTTEKNKKAKDQDNSPLKIKKFYPERIHYVSFQDIAGYEKTKEELFTIIDNEEAPGILLWGPPGNGKTLFAKALAGELGFPFFNIKGSDLENPFIGITEQNIRNLFLTAKKFKNSIIFIDEIDSIMPNRKNKNLHEHTISKTNEFLNQLNDKKNIIFLIATNRPESIDPALLRPGRIDKKCKIDYPSKHDRELIISNFLIKKPINQNKEFDIAEIVTLLEGFSCADINNFLKKITQLQDINKNNILAIYKAIQRENNIENFSFSESNTSFDDIGGYKEIKEEVKKNIIQKLTSKQAIQEKIPGCIIFGPPGTGKTLLGEAIAKEANAPMIKVTMATLLEEYPHGIEKLFQAIQKNRPCVVIFDEAEQIFISRDRANSAQKDIITDFLERTGSKNSLKGVCFIGITNYPEWIDQAITRPGRLHKKYRLDYPKFQDRIDIMNLYIKKFNIKLNKSVSLKKIAERTNGLLPSEIEHFLEIAKEILNDENKIELDQKIIAEAYQETTLGKKTTMILDKNEITQTAFHEAAHAVITLLLQKANQGYFHFDFLTIEPRAGALGISFSRESAEYKSLKKEMLLGYISVLLAGKAAQESIFKQIDAGASNDLVHATKIAEDYLKKYGMGNTLYTKPDSKNSQKEKDEIENILQKQYKKLKDFFSKHKLLLEKIVTEVIEKKVIHEEDLSRIIQNYEKNTGKTLHFVID